MVGSIASDLGDMLTQDRKFMVGDSLYRLNICTVCSLIIQSSSLDSASWDKRTQDKSPDLASYENAHEVHMYSTRFTAKTYYLCSMVACQPLIIAVL